MKSYCFAIMLIPFFLFARIEVVYHIATLNHWEEIVNEQVQALETSGLADACDRITVTVVGSEIERVRELFQASQLAHKADILHSGTDPMLCEFPGIEKVKKIAEEEPDAKILYMHTKGVTHKKGSPTHDNVLSWRRYLEHYVIANWRDCIQALDSSNCCGAEWLNCDHSPTPSIAIPGFFAGNFWWGRADYLRTCHEVPSQPWDPEWCFSHRYDCEVFITTGTHPIVKTFHQSGVNLYSFNYVPEYYQSEAPHGNVEIVYQVFASKERMALFQYHLELLEESGLAKAADRLTFLVVGPEIQTVRNLVHRPKARIIHINAECHLGEFPAIEMIKQISQANPSAKLCYLHNLEEGAYRRLVPKTYPSLQRAITSTIYQFIKKAQLWMRSHFSKKTRIQAGTWAIQNWESCLRSLSSVDVCGIGWKRGSPRAVREADLRCQGHFKNNCWWARASYLNTCGDVQYHSPFNLYDYRWGPEWLLQHHGDCQAFIGTGKNPSIRDYLKD